MSVYLYDTYAREVREFVPIEAGKVGFYGCGPTVYHYAHIGNLRTYVFEDILRRVMAFNGYDVHHVMNITDVGHLVSDGDEGEDKMEKGAARTGKTAWEIAELYTEAFLADLKALNVLDPHILCRATDHIQEQIVAIQQIEAKGLTYITSDGVYFDTAQQDSYGRLARLDIQGLQAGARVDLGEKRNPTDFALWKFSPVDEQRQMEWESPWGKGFPGWHIECSAMAAKYLGPLFDIHCGGKDHIPVHHCNEIAQAEACYDTRLANYWMHGYFLETDKEKMSKSSGEFLRIETLIERGYDPLVYRFLCLMAHYRTDMTFSWEGMDSAQTALKRLRQAYFSWQGEAQADEDFVARFQGFVNDDLNTSRAVALLWELVKSDLPEAVKKATVDRFDEVFGLGLSDWAPLEECIPAEIQALADERQAARQHKDWAAADAARDALAAEGYEVLDTPEGPVIRKK